MLKVKVRKRITEGTPPFMHHWEYSDPCVVDIKSVITDTNILEAEFTFTDETCFANNRTAVVTIQDAENCKRDFDVFLEDPCDGYDFLFFPNIQEVGRLTYRAPVPNKYGPFTFKWEFNESVFEVVEQVGDSIKLAIKEGAVLNDGEVIPLTVYVSNAYGCCIDATYQIVICAPNITELGVIPLRCGLVDCPEGQCVKLSLPVTSCETTNDCNPSFRVPIDWSSFRVDDIPGGLTMDLIDPTRKLVQITAPEDYAEGKYAIRYSVADINGVRSYGELCVYVIDCEVGGFQLVSGTFMMGCKDCTPEQRSTKSDLVGPVGIGECSGQAMAVSIPDRVVNVRAEDVDWGSFAFMPLPGQSMTKPTEMFSDFATIRFNQNREIEYIPTSPGLNIFENVRYRLKTKDGREAQSLLTFEDDICDAAPVAVPDSYFVRQGNTLDVRITDNDKGNYAEVKLLGALPGPGQGQLGFNPSTGRLTYSATGNNLPDVINLNYYLVDTQGRVSNTVPITITINKTEIAEDAFTSFCAEDAALVDLYDLINSVDNTRYWQFVGRDGGSGRFGVNGKAEVLYAPGHIFEPRTFNMKVDFRGSDPGFYTFLYTKGVGEARVSTEVIIEIVAPVEMPDTVEKLVCIDSPPFRLENMFDSLPEGGTWENVTPFGTPITNTEIVPADIGAGVSRYRYKIENTGEYNQVCDSYVDVVIEVANLLYAGEDLCFKVCSAGPDPFEEEDLCRDPRTVLNGEETCDICLWDRMFANIDPKTGEPKIITPHGKWYLKDAPFHTGNILVINGAVAVLDKGEQLPGGYQPCIDFGNVAVGKYEFEYVVEYGCRDESVMTVVVLPTPCQAEDVNVDVLLLEDTETKKLYDILIENLDPAGCLPTIKGYWILIEGDGAGIHLDNDGDGRNDYIHGGEVVGGLKRFQYNYYPTNIETEYCSETDCLDECDACERSMILTMRINPCPSLGDPRNMAVCNSGDTCQMPMQELVPDADFSDPDATYRWIYRGFNSMNPSGPNNFATGNIPDVVTTRMSMWSPGDQVLAIDTAPAPDTNENPIIEWNGADVGFYFFDLEVETPYCTESLRVVVQVVEVPNPGMNGSCLNVCDNKEECINLFCLLTGTPGTQGQWAFKSGIDCDGNAFIVPQASGPCAGNGNAGQCDPCSEVAPMGDAGFYPGIGATATFNTTGIPCGTYVFEYVSTVPPLWQGFILYGCVDGCDPRSAEVRITIVDGDNPGSGGGAGACN